MPLEYKTLKFRNDAEGLRQKDSAIAALAMDGWQVISESIESGHIKGGQACCLATICLPLGFLSKRTPGEIIITLNRQADTVSTPIMPSAPTAVIKHTAERMGARIGYFLARCVAKLRRRT